ncbi:glycosyltransferase family 2 protein [Aggregatibacter actinomycetemcomitans]|uniref:glycosyltransferase family 2 protein n=1 Tax=Aggregatibacter actinomycetemcomitans TaxID=714 RepID=UPI000D649007|nr:glycosyltransferase family 2 protein [Aggregatibacter actinomycetemcomitans]
MIGRIYIIILNYNGWKDTIECLESVLKIDYKNFKIIVVDNNSQNDSIGFICNWAVIPESISAENVYFNKFIRPNAEKPIKYSIWSESEFLQQSNIQEKLILVRANENGGFAKGNNIAIQYAMKDPECRYVWLLNNDTVIKQNTLSKLIEYADKNEIGICGSSLFYYYNPKKVQAYGGHINRFFGTSSHILNVNNIDKKLDYVVGASFLINKRLIEKIGYLPEDYFLYYEETDYCFNARKNGFTLGIALDSIVYHKEGGSTGASQNADKRSEFSDVLTLKNRIKFHKLYLGGGIGLWIGILIAFFNRIRRGQMSRIKSVFID